MADPFEALVAEKQPAAAPQADPFQALISQQTGPTPSASQGPDTTQPVPQGKEDPFQALISQSKSYAVGKPQAAPDLSNAPIEDKAVAAARNAGRIVVDNIPDSVKYIAAEMGDYLPKNGILKVLEYLHKPQEATTALAVKGLDITGLAPGIQGRLNPTGNILPKSLSPHDVIYDLLPSNQKVYDKAKQIADSMGLGEWAPESTRLLYAANKGLLGMVGDFALDPVNLIAAGAPKAAEAAMSVGRMGVESSIAQKTIQAAARGVKAAEEAPIVGSLMHVGKSVGGAIKDVGQGSVDIWNSLLPYTRIKDLDEMWILHSGMSKGINPSTAAEVFEPIKHVGVTSSEGKLIFDAMENVTNSATKEEMLKAVQNAAKKSEVPLADFRSEQLADVGMHLRNKLEENIGREVAAGVRSPAYGKEIQESPGKTIRAGVIEGYVPHRMSDSAREWAEAQVKAGKDPRVIVDEVIRREMTDAGIALDGGTRGSWVSDFDKGKYERKLRMPVQEANDYLKKGLGVDDFFVTDPIAATAQKIAETKKLALDKGLLDTVKKYGVDVSKAPKGWKPIEHYALSETENLRFPPEIADKIGFYLNRPTGGRLIQRLDQYQWLFKRLTLAKPDYYLQNIGENVTKAMALGATPRDFAYVTKVMSGKASGIPVKAGMFRTGEKLLSAADLRKEIIELGIDTGGAFREGFDSYVNMGQKMTRDGVLKGVKNAPAKVLQGIMEMGEGGENWTRRAMYISLRRQGMLPKDAMLTVERILFDYGRVTPAMNSLRRWQPFVQPVIKTANVAGELISKNPKLYNFLNNNMLQAMQSAFNDDTTQSELKAIMGKQILADYKQVQDPTFSVLLPGNGWIGKYLINQGAHGIPNEGAPFQGQAGGNAEFQLKAPIQMDILNQLNVLDDRSMLMGAGAGPVLRAALVMLTGQDIFQNKDVDLAKDYVDIASRANAAANMLVESAFPAPNLIKAVKKWAGIGDPKWIEPYSVLAIQGTVGRFAQVTNLDKDFFFRAITMKKYHESLLKEFLSRAAKEQRDAPSGGRPSEIAHTIRKWSQAAFSSDRAYGKVLQNQADWQRVNMARAGVINKMTGPEILKNIKLIEKNVKELNHNYKTVSEYRLKAMTDSKMQLDDLEGKAPPESDGEALPGGDTTE